MSKIPFLTFMILLFFSSCEKKKTVCNEDATIEAIKASLIETVTGQSAYITKEYGIRNVEQISEEIFNENLIVSEPYLQGDILQSDEFKVLCSCGTSITFKNSDEFIQHIQPIAEKLDKIEDKYSKEYLRDKHLLEFYDKNEYRFFMALAKNESVIETSPADHKVGSLLIDYLDFMHSR